MELKHPKDLQSWIGKDLPPSTYFTVGQDVIDDFAKATGDFQWVHTDPIRATEESPYGTTIAHGFLTLSLLSRLLMDQVHFPNLRLGVNYGLNKVRFTNVVPSGAQIRLQSAVLQVEDIANDGVKATFMCRIEIENQEKPALVGEFIVLFYPQI
jgi:acyl dehydratase